MKLGTPRVFAIVPAAGRSRRMGTPKQLLDVGGRSMLNAVLEPLVAAHIEGVVLVTYSAMGEKIDIACRPGVFIALNNDETSEMIDSVRIGLTAWLEREPIRAQDGFLICPADHPGITTADFDKCITAFQHTPDRIVIASRAGRRGHPIIFPAALAPFVESDACDQGLNGLPRSHRDRIVLVECRSTGVTFDVDTPTDYDRLV